MRLIEFNKVFRVFRVFKVFNDARLLIQITPPPHDYPGWDLRDFKDFRDLKDSKTLKALSFRNFIPIRLLRRFFFKKLCHLYKI